MYKCVKLTVSVSHTVWVCTIHWRMRVRLEAIGPRCVHDKMTEHAKWRMATHQIRCHQWRRSLLQQTLLTELTSSRLVDRNCAILDRPVLYGRCLQQSRPSRWLQQTLALSFSFFLSLFLSLSLSLFLSLSLTFAARAKCSRSMRRSAFHSIEAPAGSPFHPDAPTQRAVSALPTPPAGLAAAHLSGSRSAVARPEAIESLIAISPGWP